MARIQPKKIQDYSLFTRSLFFIQKKKYGAVPEPLLLWGRTPRVLRRFLSLFKALDRKDSPLTPQLRALVCVKVSQINDCPFCVDMNAAMALQRGSAQEKLTALPEFELNPLFSLQEKIALKYAQHITQSQQTVDDLLFKELTQHFNEDAIVELTALIAFQNMSSKFNAALGAKAFGFCQSFHKEEG